MEEIYKTSRSVIDYKKHFFISILMIAFALIFTINYLPNLIPVLPVMSEDSDSFSIPTPSSLEKIEKRICQQWNDHGKKSLLKSKRSLEKRIEEHKFKLEKYSSEGGYVSSIQREIRAFETELSVIKKILDREDCEE